MTRVSHQVFLQRVLFALLLSIPSLHAQTTFTGGPGATLDSRTNNINPPAALSPYGTAINVTGLNGTVTNVTVQVTGFNATADYALCLALVSPSGRKLALVWGAGSGSGVGPINIGFSDAGTTLVENQSNPPQFANGTTYKPVAYADYGFTTMPFPSPVNTPSIPETAGSATFANTFGGDTANGSWKLYGAQYQNGTLTSYSSWSITITTGSAATTSTSLTSSLNPSFVGNNVTFTATVLTGSTPVTSGTVTFKMGTATVSGPTALNGSGQAVYSTTSLAEGSDTVTAFYNGTSSFGVSSGSFTETVNRHSTVSNTSATTGTFCNPGQITIPQTGLNPNPPGLPSSPYPSLVYIGSSADPTGPGQPANYAGTLSNLTINLNNFTLPNEDGASMLLVSPNGRAYDFFSNVGNTSSSNNASNLTFTIDDAAATQLPSTALASGTFKPADYVNTAQSGGDTFASPAPSSGILYAAPFGSTTLGQAFNGISPNGSWSLYIVDKGSGIGQLAGGWCLNITTLNNAVPTNTTISSSNSESFTDQAVTFTATVKNGTTPVTTGTVTFTDGVTQVQGPVAPNASGQVTYTAAANAFTQGSHMITATYSGATGFGTSYASLTQFVDKHTVVTGNQYCNPGPVSVPANSTQQTATPYPVNVFVGGADPNSTPLAGTLKTVSVSLNGFTETFPSDFRSLLIGPNAMAGAGPGGTLSQSLDFFSHAGGGNSVSSLNLVFADTGSGTVPAASIASATYKPTSLASSTYAAPAPVGPYQYPSTVGSATFTSAFASSGYSTNGMWSFYFATADRAGEIDGSGVGNNAVCLTFTTNPPAFGITKTHTGNFTQGGTATYTITVTNNGPGSTAGTVTVTEIPPASGMTLTGLAGTNWTCSVASKTCTRSDVLGAGSSYDAITATLAVASNAATGTNALTNGASVTGGGASNSPTASDPTTIIAAPSLSVAKSHTGTFAQGSTGEWDVTVSNGSGDGPTSGTTTVSDTLPSGYTVNNFGTTSGTWSCSGAGTQTATCTSTQSTSGGTSFAAIQIIVNIPANSEAVTNTASAYGGGDLNHTSLATAATGSNQVTVAQTASTITATAGTPQSATINTAFATQFQTTVKDGANSPVAGIIVTFTAPASGASGKFANNTTVSTTSTNASGIAVATLFTANATAGAYTVVASVSGVSSNASFALTNTAGAASSVTATAGTPQSAAINAAFANSLQATVKDSGSNPVSGVTVTFTAPATGASGKFSDTNSNTTTAVTNASGIAAAAAFTANGTAGGYSVAASAPGVGTNASFALTNTAGSAASVTATAGTPQSAAINAAFATSLQATVKDSGSNPVAGVTVTFTAPASGASGTFANTNSNTTTAVTNTSGIATAAAFTANGTAGGYSVAASAPGVGTNASFALTNTAGSAASVTATAGTPQSAAINAAFATALQATVKDSGSNPVAGVTVTFTAPASGASGTFANTNSNTTTAVTNASGIATATAFTANGTAGGPYTVTASLIVGPSANFSLTNIGSAAVVTGVTSTTANGSYTTGAAIGVTVSFSKAVIVTGTPSLALNSGGTAAYVSGSGTAALTFSYTVAAGQNSSHLDYTSSGALTLNGGSIQDASNTAANLTLPAPGSTGSLGANKSIVIDTTAPTVVSYSVLFGSQSYNLAGTTRNRLPWQITGVRVVFSKAIASGNANSLGGATPTGFAGLGTNTLTWTVSPLIQGSFATTLAGSGPNVLADAAGNPLMGGAGYSQALKVLYGDFNDDGFVSSTDLVGVNAARSAAYNIFADMNGDTLVDANDVQIVRTRIGASLP